VVREAIEMVICKECVYCHISSESGYGYCFAPLPYWINVDRGVAVVVGVIGDDIKRTCHCFREKQER
jgi:hypothetical protein